MYFEGFETRIEKKRALANAVELSRITTALIPSIALTEILMSSEAGAVLVIVFCYSRVKTTPEQRALLGALVFDRSDLIGVGHHGSYEVLSERYGSHISTEELSAPCYNYPWFAPVELAVLKTPLEYTNHALSIRVPSLLAGERLKIKYPHRSEPLPSTPHMSNKYVGQYNI